MPLGMPRTHSPMRVRRCLRALRREQILKRWCAASVTLAQPLRPPFGQGILMFVRGPPLAEKICVFAAIWPSVGERISRPLVPKSSKNDAEFSDPQRIDGYT